MRHNDFTQGNLFKQIVLFSGPIMLTNLLQVSYQFIDSLWVGNLVGADALGAVAVSSTVIFTVLSFIIGINGATLTILSQQKGMANEDGLRRYLNAFVVLLTVMAVALGALGFALSGSILRWMGTPESILPLAKSYLQINFIGIVFLFGYNFIGTVLRATGDSRTPIRFVLLAVVLNTGIDPLFISGFGLGIDGAAYATILSQGFAFMYGLYLILRRKLVPFPVPFIPAKTEVSLILKLGVPAGLQMMVVSGGLMAVMSVVNSFGSAVVAGFGAAGRLDSVLLLPAQALGSAVNSMAGQNIGAGNQARVRQIALYGILYNFLIMSVVVLLTVLFARVAVTLFVQQEESVDFGAQYLRTIAWMYPFVGINFVLNGIIRASGAMFVVLLLNIVSFWLLRYPLTLLLSMGFAERGIGLGIGASFVLSSVISLLYYRFGAWRRKELFRRSGAA
ncbi:MAG: Nadriven multidrug efflux pump [Paenibacillaceae bacterium]|jgi:putative MATE family efflux protein|nr:Nadriven multidrug efflux pump [Paenibacillaceae bacterium]